MSIYDSIRAQIVPITPEGYPFIGAFALGALVLFWIWTPLGWIGTLATVWCALFFRDPPRVTPVRDGLVVAPADGRISQITTAALPHELGLGAASMLRVSIFMSVFDCHINRSPVSGRVEKILYQPGKFFNADLDKASADNERNSLVIAAAGARVVVVQIAGLIARRIVCFVREGQPVGAGERFGMIRFGSRLDVYLPEGTPVQVAVGQCAVGGETVLADLRTADASRAFRSRLTLVCAHRGARGHNELYCTYGLSTLRPCAAGEAPPLQGDSRAHAAAEPDHAVGVVRGLTAIRVAVEGKIDWAIAAIVIAALLDGIDGRIARMLKGTSRFGAELDSLADFVNFGVAPALILYFWGLQELKSAGWIAALVFAICAGLRLARFNVMVDDPGKPVWSANFFTGIPAPAGAITVLLPIYLNSSWASRWA